MVQYRQLLRIGDVGLQDMQVLVLDCDQRFGGTWVAGESNNRVPSGEELHDELELFHRQFQGVYRQHIPRFERRLTEKPRALTPIPREAPATT